MTNKGKNGTSNMRTKSGGVSAEARKKHGMRSKTATPKSFPIFDKTSADSALRLRGRAHTKKDRLNIINRAREYVPEAAKEAYANDKRSRKI
jgi:hypothetical protein